ncbi:MULTISPECIES: DegT/DnrJ/EryC1/StrS family aminotransferase [Methanobacterium]|uniref:Aminotransferase DegT n=1 Tax=Methanobacterium bryantii TaxID=2161 RepID=A0A2A2H3D2_METBR|nr:MULTISPECIES: DegT/DnrJ/EryC1/StrS family aminotransferase [Methanobacterium]OEC86092.1 aminotransferase DegT [Methanobacterium sp. A39]PAV03919.1 aminotransferase DegT [Methanobacterium bryantii]
MKWKIPLFKIYQDDDDIQSVTNIIKNGSHWADGREIQLFENEISQYLGRKYAVTFNSGTSALHTLLLAHGIKNNDEIIVPSFTFISTANAPLFVKAKPVFAEIEDKTYGLDPEDVKEKINPKTKAIIPIHYGGSPCLIRELKEIADDYNVLLIEDTAESLGAKIKDKKLGSFGDSAILSFCQNKVISTGEGGAVVTDSKEIYDKLKLIRSHGRLDAQDYFSSTNYMDYITLGYNFRMPTMCAALGLSQLKKIDSIIKMRRSNSSYLTKKLSKNGITIPKSPSDYYNVHQLFTIRIEEQRDELMEYMSNKGIMTKVYFSPVHLTHFYQKKLGYKIGDLPVTEKVSNQVLSLPMYPTLTKREMDYIAENIEKFLKVK